MEQTSLSASLARLYTTTGTVVGAGFLVGERQVLTCAHVIAEALDLPEDRSDLPRAEIVLDFPLLAPRLQLTAHVVRWLPVEKGGGGDIAGLELLSPPPADARPVHFSPANDVWEHPFRAFGFPVGQDEGVWATGHLLGRQANHWLQLEDVKTEGFAVMPGFSGGPVWDPQLQGVVGMVVAANRRAETKTAFLIPFDLLAASWSCLQPVQHQRVFLSAAPGDRPFAERLAADLRAEGMVVWDESQGPPGVGGTSTLELVRQAIRDAQAILLVVSPRARTSHTVKEHLHLANMYQRRIILTWVGTGERTPLSLPAWQDTLLVDAQNAPYEAALTQIENALNQERSSANVQVSLTEVEERVEETGPQPRNPYKGLRPFLAEDVGDFFGRERLANELTQDLAALLTPPVPNTESERCLAIIGPSGSGKSSVVRAGLLPRLQLGALPGSDSWIYLDPMVPGKHPLETLTQLLKPFFPDTSFKTLREDLEDDATQGLHLLASQLVKEPGGQIILLVDQFEEVFTLTETERERQQFLDLLLTAATTPGGPLFVLLTLRADFYDRPMQYPRLSRLIQAHERQVLPMEVEDLRATIEQPAVLPGVGLSFEGNLVGDMLFEVQGQIGALPLLQFTLQQLFERREGHHLTLQAYHALGGVKGALARHTEQTYTDLPSEEHRRLARTLFLRLLEPGASQRGTTRRRAALSEFTFADPTQTRLMRETIDRFVTARLLTASEVGGITTIEVGHEAVIREWPRLAGWLREAREDIQIQQTLSADVARWEQHHHPKERLYRGTQFKEAQAWAKRNQPSEREAAFLRASTAWRSMVLVRFAVVALLLVSSMSIAGRAIWQSTHQPDPTLVTRLQDSSTLEGSLRWCIDHAREGSTIHFDSSMRGIIELTEGSLVVANKERLTLAGPGADRVVITSNNKNAQILIPKGAVLTISGLSFKNSKTEGSGILRNEGSLTIDNSIISDNKVIISADSVNGGGGISNVGILMITNSTISNNSSSGNQHGRGGGIYNDGMLTITRSLVSHNIAYGTGGVGIGGGIYNYVHGTVTITGSKILNNSASGKTAQGGGIDNHGKLIVKHTRLSNNSANSEGNSVGGGMNNYYGTAFVTDSTFSGNRSVGARGGHGGGIGNEDRITVEHSRFLNNIADSSNGKEGHGGSIANLGSGIVKITASTFSANLANNKPNDQGRGLENEGEKEGGKLIVSP